MKVEKLENNRFIVGRKFSVTFQLWGKNDIKNNYECIFEGTLPRDMYYSLFANRNLFYAKIKDKILFYKHDFSFNNRNILLKQYESKDISSEILGTRKNKKETIYIYDFKYEIVCKLKSNIIGEPVCSYKNFIYFLYEGNKELYAINFNNFKIKKYYIDLETNYFRPNSLKFISNEKILYGDKKIIEYKLDTNNNRFLKNKTCSENNSKYYGSLVRGKNGDIIYYGDRILFFSRKDLLND